MAVLSTLDIHHARVRDALILPFQRRIASLTIRTDIWKDTLAGKSATADGQVETRSRALGAITEVDDQVTLLMDLKLPGEKEGARFRSRSEAPRRRLCRHATDAGRHGRQARRRLTNTVLPVAARQSLVAALCCRSRTPVVLCRHRATCSGWGIPVAKARSSARCRCMASWTR